MATKRNSTATRKLETPTDETLQVEYAATNETFMHYDNFSWQVGGILIAGAFIFWGFLANQDINLDILVVSSILVASLMSVWYLYTNHNRQLYICKLHRLHEIEKILGMQQHRLWRGSDPVYKTYGLNGHSLDALIYVIVSLGTPLISAFNKGMSIWFVIPLAITIICLVWAFRNVQSLKKHLARKEE